MLIAKKIKIEEYFTRNGILYNTNTSGNAFIIGNDTISAAMIVDLYGLGITEITVYHNQIMIY